MSKLESPAEKKTEHEITIEVEKVVLPQVVSIKKASELMGLPAYYLRRLCKEVPGLAFHGISTWENWQNTTTISKTRVLEHDIASLSRLSTSESTAYFFFAVGSKVEVSNRTGG